MLSNPNLSGLYPHGRTPSNFWTGRGSGTVSSHDYSPNVLVGQLETPIITYPFISVTTQYGQPQISTHDQPLIGHIEGKCPVGPCASGPFSCRDR